MEQSLKSYIERYNDIQRFVYEFCDEVLLEPEDQLVIAQKFSLGTDFVFLESIQEYNKQLLLKGYEKVNCRELDYQKGKIHGRFVENGNYLKEVVVSIPRQLFEPEGEGVKNVTYSYCVSLVDKNIRTRLKYLEHEKEKIEMEIEKYNELLNYSLEE